MRYVNLFDKCFVSRIVASLVLFVVITSLCSKVAASEKTPRKPKNANTTACRLKSSRTVGSVDRITVKLDAGGKLKFVEDDKVGREKMSVVAELDYTEKTLALPDDAKKLSGVRSVRFYDRAEAVIKVGDGGFKPTLRDQRSLIAVDVADDATMFSPMGPLSRDELDLLDIHANSLLLDRLLPTGPIAQGDQWEQSQALMKVLLGLDKIAKCDIKSTLSKLTDTQALISISGRVEGAIGGVSTKMDVKAKYRFNRKAGRIDWLGLLVKEDRDIGHVNTGVELVARVQMQIKPGSESERLADAALDGLPLSASDETGQLVYHSQSGGWQFSHDRRWFVTDDRRSRAVFRLVDSGELVAQCNVMPLSSVEPGKQITLEQFQSDIKEALGESFGQFVKASQQANDANYRVFRVVVDGESSELPIRWIYYLIADEQGRQVAVTFTVEETHVERLANADRAVVETLRFTEPNVAERTGEKSTR